MCGHISSPKTAIKGNGLIEIFLWFFFIIPGIIYSIWRSSSRYKVCRKCHGTNLIPLDTPVGQKILQDQGKTLDQVLLEKDPDAKILNTRRKIIYGALLVFVIFSILVVVLAS